MTPDESSLCWAKTNHRLRETSHGHCLRTVVCLDQNMGGGRGPEINRGQRVGLSGVIKKRSGVRDLDGTFFALLYQLRLQLLRHLFEVAEKHRKYVL